METGSLSVRSHAYKYGVGFRKNTDLFLSFSPFPFFLYSGNYGDHMLKVEASQYGIAWKLLNFLKRSYTRDSSPIIKNYILLNKISQLEKDKYHDFTHMWNLMNKIK